MAKALRLIGPEDGLQFQLDLHDGSRRGALAWGDGLLLLQGEPIWCREDDDGSTTALHWTWIDLLEGLAEHWPALLLEETYPIPVLPLYPGLLRREAERRWEDQPDEIIDAEDEAVYRFLLRHDLAMTCKGLFVPSLLLLRQGQHFAVSCAAASDQHLMLPYADVVATLTELGNHIAVAVRTSDEARAERALALWDSRDQRLRAEAPTLLSGLDRLALQRLAGGTPANDFWEIDDANPTADTVILAAARMSAGCVDMDTQRQILERLRATPKRDTSALDELMERAEAEMPKIGRPFEQGYRLAAWLRSTLNLSPENPCEPKALLASWGVDIQSVDTPTDPIDAIAAWGNDHGPVILLNRRGDDLRSISPRERATLAHEICHLLIDRRGALPAAEVLGGRTPEYAEKRARAFAAELLLPREAAADNVRKAGSLSEAIAQLQQTYHVSKALLGWQIRNSSAFHRLSLDEQSMIERMTQLQDNA